MKHFSFRNLRFTAIASIAVVISLFAAVAFAGQAITLDQYQSRLSQLHADLTAAQSGNTGAAGKALSEAQALQGVQVVLDSAHGRTLAIPDNRVLIGAVDSARISGISGDYAKAAGYVAQVIDDLPDKSTAPSPNIDPKQTADTVLAGVAFSSAPVPEESLWDRFWDWVADEFKKIHWPHFGGGPTMPSVSPIIPEVFLVIVLVAAVALLGYIVFQIIASRQARQGRLSQAESMLAINAEERELVATHNYARLMQLASEAASTGNHRSAFRLVFLALLVFLDSEGAIRLNRSRTNWEYLRGLRDRDTLASQLRPLVRDFDRIWYGEEPATEVDYNNARAVFEQVSESILGTHAGPTGVPGSARRKMEAQ